MNHMSKKHRYILFSMTTVMIFIAIIFIFSFGLKKNESIFDKIDTNMLRQIDVDNVLSESINRDITNELLSEKGYVVSDKQIFSEMDNAIWYDSTQLSSGSPLSIKDFSIQISKSNHELIGVNFYYAPIDIRDQNLENIISIYGALAETDKFTARSGEQFTYKEISTFSDSDFEHYGSKFQIINTSYKKSVALFLEIEDSKTAYFYGVVSKQFKANEKTQGTVLCVLDKKENSGRLYTWKKSTSLIEGII